MSTWNHKKTMFGKSIYVFIAICHMFIYVHVDSLELPKLKGVIKTIQGDDGDIIDCVDIYEQPAFNHPLLKNHTIQMKPSSYPRGMEANTFEAEMLQDWDKNGECPEGTIPILRSQGIKFAPKTSFDFPRKKVEVSARPNHEYAQVFVVDGNYFGASGRFNVWRPGVTSNNEFSSAQIWVSAVQGDELNTVEAGWQAHQEPHLPRLFIFWTSNSYNGTGCYNLECPGFVQTSKRIVLGGGIAHLSVYGGQQMEMSIFIHKDKQSGNWWLRINEIDIGYWPGSIFSGLSDRADAITWGGEIINLGLQGRHTSTQMGSGHFPSEGYGKASYIRNVRHMDESGVIKDAREVFTYVTKPGCYDLKMGNIRNYGTHFFFGGPGYSDKCLV